jgi:hypothetical protein
VTKQYYSSLTNIKQIQSINDTKLHQFCRPYYQKQQYLLSGIFHISSNLTFQELCMLPTIDEWLDTYKYFLKLCPSQTEGMTQIGALCYSNLFMYCKDLKTAILSHRPIFDLYISDFITPGKKTKMIFISAEQSCSTETIELLKQIYDGSPKAYPNGYMMMLISLLNGHQPTPEF